MEKLDLDTLKSWLWNSADILRGSIDSSDFKNYILNLLFLKRVNDVFDEQKEKALAEGADEDEAEDTPFIKVPTAARWVLIAEKTEGLGIALDKAFAAIEQDEDNKVNLGFENVLTATKFGDTERLSNEVIQQLLRHFSKHSLRNEDLYKADFLGDAYEYLIEQFAGDAGKKGGEFYTPRGVVKLIVQLIKPQPGHTVYDPTCGSGGMLVESARYIGKQPNGLVGDIPNVQLFGQEKNLGTWAIGKLNMVLHRYESADLRKGDTLTNPQHKTDDTSLRLFDRVIANPPFSQKKWWSPLEKNIKTITDPKTGKQKEQSVNYNKEVSDAFGRFQYGIPPRGYADLGFLQHMIAVLKQNGRAGVVLPHGTLFRGGTEGDIRQKLLQADLIEGIVGLPSALFYNTGIPASIWIINKSKVEQLKNKIVIIDASQEYKEGKNQNSLEDGNIERIIKSYDALAEVDKFMRVVPMTEIKENDYNLNISRYIDTSEKEERVDIIAVRQNIINLEEQAAAIDAELQAFLKGLNL
jgi:type I restriction enzyme M protein